MNISISELSIIPIVCVNYNSENDCFDYANKHASPNNPVIIIDNSENISEKLKSLEKNKYTFYYFNNKNIGYLNALGIGILHANELFPNYRFIALTNVDLEYDATHLNQYLLEHGRNHINNNIGLMGPRIISSHTNLNQNPFLKNRPTKLKIKFLLHFAFNGYIGIIYHALSELSGKFKSLISRKKEKISENLPNNVYSVHGSFLLLSRNFVEKISPISWPCFLFGEEIWFSEMARINNFGVLYFENLLVTHKEHVTTGLVKNKKRLAWHRQSMKYLHETFFK